MVLSKLRTLTAFKVTSMTFPSAPYLFIVIQSPGRSISLADSWIPATNPKIVSLNTNMSIAAEAPNPAKRDTGDLLINTLMISIIPTKTMATCKICMNPFSGLFLKVSFWLYISWMRFSDALINRKDTAMI